jgi:LacI family kdg operon repressor
MTSPPVSAIIPPAQEEGKRAMTELLELLDGKKKDTEVVFKNIVKWRGTTV